MADLSPDKIIEPISEDQPCGPDLDMEDMDYANFMAEIGGHIPERYFSFDPDSIDFDDVYTKIDEFLDRSRDIRLLVLLAKMRILNGQIDGFIDALEATHALLKAHWADVHPAGDMDFMRPVELATLDDMPTSILPLQHATLFRSRRAGAITLRKWQLAKGDVQPREGEDVVDGGTIMSEIGAADVEEMKAIIAKMERGRDAINGIRTVCISEGDFESAPTYERLPAAFEDIIEFISQGIGLDQETGGATEGAGEDGEGADGVSSAASMVVQMPTGDVQTREDAIDALFAAEKYYALYEPSSPNVLLLREARNAANKTFAELVSELLPSSSSAAYFTFGKEPWFEVPLSDIDSRNPAPDYEGEEEEASSGSSWEDAGLDDGPTSNDEPKDDGWTSNDYGGSVDQASNDEPDDGGWSWGGDDKSADDTTAADTTAADETPADESADAAADAAEDTPAEQDTGEAADEPAAEASEEPVAAAEDQAEDAAAEDTGDDEDPGDEGTGAKKKFVARTRPEALALIEKVRAYYRVAEPSSPVALMLDRVVDLSSKNFIGVLREVLPDGHLKVKADPHSSGNDSSSSSGW